VNAPSDRRSPDEDGGIGPYLTVLLLAVVVGLALLAYLVGYRDEIMAILTQLPT
jgi:hypothetical protein